MSRAHAAFTNRGEGREPLNNHGRKLINTPHKSAMLLLLKPSFGGVGGSDAGQDDRGQRVRCRPFRNSCSFKKQSKVTGQKKQLRLDLTGVYICTRARDRNNTVTNDKSFDFLLKSTPSIGRLTFVMDPEVVL